MLFFQVIKVAIFAYVMLKRHNCTYHLFYFSIFIYLYLHMLHMLSLCTGNKFPGCASLLGNKARSDSDSDMGDTNPINSHRRSDLNNI